MQGVHKPGDSGNVKNCQNVRKTQRSLKYCGKIGTSGKM